MIKRVIFYIDGFNFYNGLKSISNINHYWKKFYWIDFVKFCNSFLNSDHHELTKVKYFTAPPLNNGKKERQKILFDVNKKLNGSMLEFINGKYYEKPYTCPHCRESFIKPEEKRTDVNISTNLIGDCALNKVDLLILITADSDLVPPLQFIQENFPDKIIKVYFPPHRNSADIFDRMGRKVVYLKNNKGKFEQSVLPDEVSFDDGSKLNIPERWKV